MKRLISMILAVMMVVTLGVMPAAAIEHESHFIEFTGAIDGQISLGEATVGVSYSYPFQTERCSGIAQESLSFSSPDLERLSIGLSLTPAGLITGTPSAAGEYEFEVEVRGTCSDDPTETPVVETVTCTLTVGPHAHSLDFDYEQMDDHDGDDADVDLSESIVGQEYNYQLKYISCDHATDIVFSAEEDYMDGTRRLPDGLEFDTETGIISGTPEEGTEGVYRITFLVEGKAPRPDGEEFETLMNSAVFYLTVLPESDGSEMITWEIPYTKRVVRGGRKNPGPQTFTLEIYEIGNTSATAPIQILDGTNTIHTDGTQSEYSGVLKVKSTKYTLTEGFKVREKNEGAERWTYSDAF